MLDAFLNVSEGVQSPVKSFPLFWPAFVVTFCTVTLSTATRAGQTLEEASNHWAFQPLSSPAIPKVHARSKVQSPVDAFILAKLEQAGLNFAPTADKRTLLRRA